MGKGKTMANKGTTTNNGNNGKVQCQYCGKWLTKAQTQTQGHGKRCATVQALVNNGNALPKQYVASMPKGFIKVAQLHKVIISKKASIAGLTIAKMVKAIGTDKGIYPPIAPIAQVYYLPNGHRVVNQWLSTTAGLQAIASGNYSNAPKAPKVQTMQA